MSVRLSYSSMKTVQSCEQKYAFYKIHDTPKDEDYEESEALGVGKAFHKVLESSKHTGWTTPGLMEAMTEFNVGSSETQLLSVMLDKYVTFRAASGLRVIRCEFGIQTSMYTGFCDAIAVDPISRLWWIIDLKTTARHDPNLIPQLAKDMQVGLYSHFAPDIEKGLEPKLDGYTFGGFRYCQIIKSKAKTLQGLINGVNVYEMVIPEDIIDSGAAWSLFSEVHDRVEELHKGEAPRKNLASCFNYFSPCQYFSKCHGTLFSRGHEQIKILTIENLNDGALL